MKRENAASASSFSAAAAAAASAVPAHANRAKVAPRPAGRSAANHSVNGLGSGGGFGAPPPNLAPASAGLLPPKHEMSPMIGGPVAIGSLLQQHQQQDVRWRGHEHGFANGRGGGGGLEFTGMNNDRRRSSGTTVADSFGSRRSSLGSILGVSLDGDRRYSLEPDGGSGGLLPFDFPPGDGGGAGSAGAEAWEGGGMSGGGGRVPAEEHGSGGGIAEAEQAARMMAARRNSLEEGLYGTGQKRSSFQTWVSFFFFGCWETGHRRTGKQTPNEGVASVCSCYAARGLRVRVPILPELSVLFPTPPPLREVLPPASRTWTSWGASG